MGTLLLAYRLTGPLWPTGPGDRLPASPAPGAVPRGEPLLPRLETLLYALTPHAKALGAKVDHVKTCEKMLDEIIRTLFDSDFDSKAVVAGPLLLAGTRSGPRLYINAATHLLDLEALDEYVEIARAALEALEDPNPSRRRRTLSEAKARIEELEEKGLLVPWEMLAKRRQRVALRHDTKTAAHGLIFTETRVDYTTLLLHKPHVDQGDEPKPKTGPTTPTLLVIVLNPSRTHNELDGSVALLTPSKTPAELRITRLPDLHGNRETEAHVSLTPTPIDEAAGEAIHPLLFNAPRPHHRLTVLASSCKIRGKHFSKTTPRLAYPSGTIYFEENRYSNVHDTRRKICHTVSSRLLKELAKRKYEIISKLQKTNINVVSG